MNFDASLIHSLFNFFFFQELRLMAGIEIKFGLTGIEIEVWYV